MRGFTPYPEKVPSSSTAITLLSCSGWQEASSCSPEPGRKAAGSSRLESNFLCCRPDTVCWELEVTRESRLRGCGTATGSAFPWRGARGCCERCDLLTPTKSPVSAGIGASILLARRRSPASPRILCLPRLPALRRERQMAAQNQRERTGPPAGKPTRVAGTGGFAGASMLGDRAVSPAAFRIA